MRDKLYVLSVEYGALVSNIGTLILMGGLYV